MTSDAAQILRHSKVQKLTHAEIDECYGLVDRAEAVLRALGSFVAMSPGDLGKRSGLKTAERGLEFLNQIAGMRKTKAGGRPRKAADH